MLIDLCARRGKFDAGPGALHDTGKRAATLKGRSTRRREDMVGWTGGWTDGACVTSESRLGCDEMMGVTLNIDVM